jgi:alpha-1,6-mannosyltransferase
VKRYVHEKIAFIQRERPDDEHVFIIPGARTGVAAAKRSRVYTIASPLISRTTQYRALLDLRAIGEIIERERPDIIESGDPYQVGWRALRVGDAQQIPVVAFYHSHFAEAYLRGPLQHSLGKGASDAAMKAARAYVRNFYNRFAATLFRDFYLARAEQYGLLEPGKAFNAALLRASSLLTTLRLTRSDARAGSRS